MLNRFTKANLKMDWIPADISCVKEDFLYLANLMYDDYEVNEVEEIFNDPKLIASDINDMVRELNVGSCMPEYRKAVKSCNIALLHTLGMKSLSY